ncbi:MAG: septal ring lytic transglycosylase RlpA family protein [Aquificae bacterium]|nr:septal ring lytic transglycosylase RlpA family protein [Aquificota bacterium]
MPFRLLLFVFVIFALLSCAKKGEVYKGGKLSSRCPRVLYTRVYYCPTLYAYTNKFQHLSKVKVVNPKTKRSITIAVRYNPRVKGLCLPKKYRKILGPPFYGKVYLLRCGENGARSCPRVIRGYASWYGKEFHGRKTASGIRFNAYGLYAAHRYLPFGTLLEVKNLKNGKKVVVEVVDRGPFVKGRHLDLSYGAAKKLGMIRDGVIPFEARVLRCGY